MSSLVPPHLWHSRTGLTALANQWGLTIGHPTGMGDQNGDGVVDQVFGSLIVRHGPTITSGVSTPVVQSGYATFDNQGRVISRCRADGVLSVYEYDSNEFLAAIIADADPSEPGVPPNIGTGQWAKPGFVDHVHAITRYERNAVGAITAVTDPRGVKTTYWVGAENRVHRMTRGAAFDSSVGDAHLNALENAGYHNLVTPGYETYFSYDLNGRLIQVDTANVNSGQSGNLWLTEQYVYNRYGGIQKTKIERAIGDIATTEYHYDANGNLHRTTHPEGNFDEWDYDESNFLYETILGASDPLTASTMIYERNENGVIVKEVEPVDFDGDGAVETSIFVRDGFDRLHQSISPVGTVQEEAYSADGDPATRKLYGTLGGPSASLNDTSSNVLLTESSLSHDEVGRMILSRRRAFTPDPQHGLPYTPSDQWVEVQQVYDLGDNVVEEIDSDGSSITRVWDGLNRLVRQEDELGNVFEYEFDNGGNRVRSIETFVDPIGGSVSTRVHDFVHDAFGQVVRLSDSEGNTQYAAYCSRGSMVVLADGNGPTMADPLGLVGGTINGTGNTKRWVFDGISQVTDSYVDLRIGGAGNGTPDLLAGVDPSVAPLPSELDLQRAPSGILHTHIDYDLNGNVSSATTDGKTVSFVYDHQDRLKTKTLADNSRQEWTYEKDGSVEEHTFFDQAGQLFRGRNYSYDVSGRLIALNVTLPAGSLIEGTTQQEFEYNGLNLETRARDDNGSDVIVTRKYDSRGRLLKESRDNLSTCLEYDDRGDLHRLWMPSGRVIRYERDQHRRLAEVRNDAGGGLIAEYDYFGNKLVAEVRFGNGTVMSYRSPAMGGGTNHGYDASGNPMRLEHLSPMGGISTALDYTFDRTGAQLSKALSVSGGASHDVEYEYDSGIRLESSTRVDAGTGNLELKEIFDVGATSSWKALTLDNGSQSSTYPFTAGPGHEYDVIGTSSLAHDAAGNRVADAWFVYRFDAFDRLVRVAHNLDPMSPEGVEGPTVLNMSYDAFGRRVEKSSTLAIRYYYFLDQVIEERNGSSDLMAQYVYGNWVDEVLEMSRDLDGDLAFEPYFILSDPIGSSIGLSDASGTTVERYRYDTFGKPYFLNPDGTNKPVQGSAFGLPFLFQGREYDRELAEWKLSIGAPYGYFDELDSPTGQYFFRARYLDPSEGRFVSRDPLAMETNESLLPWDLMGRVFIDGYLESPYAFTNNQPTNSTDPFGNSVKVLWLYHTENAIRAITALCDGTFGKEHRKNKGPFNSWAGLKGYPDDVALVNGMVVRGRVFASKDVEVGDFRGLSSA